MTVKRLKELLEGVDDNLHVFVGVENEGIFGFQEACECETGAIELGPAPGDLYSNITNIDDHIQMKVFAVLPHGFTGPNDEEPIHKLN